ncbi:uncharacterized protein J7T54_003970 [Emericellopsis cladophorae]|uniref:GP-PDE domain-containing protein n=1 Tax=Emericellopsis cladophorae TaxID=2686198 RepID=A0A9P9Y1A5_9HYPO|nr:uncharacterized protein J7T54_003970 [Emericellopsis cladophorae]KAI6781704.1 hypothetical protein J7T54_003970 [Emericellopsis cladophorae]
MAVECKQLLQRAPQPIPKAPCLKAPAPGKGTRVSCPQNIAHRGYKASFPENTMGAFRGAVDVGAHAIETDLHLSKDGVVVLSHDATLKRCFGIDMRISECNWDFLATLRTLRDKNEGMPRLRDLLDLMNRPGMERLWILLDVKEPWHHRVVLGLWNTVFLKAARRHLPEYPMVHISFYLPYSRHFLSIPNLGFNIFQKVLVGKGGRRFMQEAQERDRPVLAWTVNEERWMEWCIAQNETSSLLAPEQTSTVHGRMIDGVITDDPLLFSQVCDRYEQAGATKLQGWARTRSHIEMARQVMVVKLLAMGVFLVRVWQGKLDWFGDLEDHQE